MIQICANKSVQYITKENPYGYHDGFNRLDTAEGVKSFCDTLIPLLKDAHGQGVIIWGQQGTEPRGAEYRPDFDILPPENASAVEDIAGQICRSRFATRCLYPSSGYCRPLYLDTGRHHHQYQSGRSAADGAALAAL